MQSVFIYYVSILSIVFRIPFFWGEEKKMFQKKNICLQETSHQIQDLNVFTFEMTPGKMLCL